MTSAVRSNPTHQTSIACLVSEAKVRAPPPTILDSDRTRNFGLFWEQTGKDESICRCYKRDVGYEYESEQLLMKQLLSHSEFWH
uniref:Uncharacterized protein n=1 Tax=Trichuris muris TaxID=70415 RepID=A0A5S6PZ54_TRIMR